MPPIDPLPARSLEDLSLDEKVTAPDFKLGERYLDLSKELSRLALLGIAGYGFLIKEIAMKGESTRPFLGYMVQHPYLPLLGLLAFGLSAASSLLTSQISTNCMKLQIDIIRYVKRRTNPGWTDEERQHNDLYLADRRNLQRTSISHGRMCLRAAVLLLIAGTLLTVLSFALILSTASVVITGDKTNPLDGFALR
jgi:hypothetical protein